MPTNRFFNRTITYGDIDRNLTSKPASVLFHSYLTDDGSDSTLNENYSSATDTYVAFTRPAVIETCTIELLDGDIAQNAVLSHEFFVGAGAALTNGFKFLVENSAGTSLLDITNSVPLKNLAQMDAISEFVTESSNVSNATTTANHHAYACRMNFTKLFGRGIQVNTSDRFVCVMQDDLSGLAFVYIHIYGYYL